MFFNSIKINQQYKKGVLSAGLVVKNEFVDNLDTYKYQQLTPFTEIIKGQGMWYMPFVDFAGKIGSKWDYSVGTRGNYFSFKQSKFKV